MQTTSTYRTNRDLFSNYYVEERLPETEAWDDVDNTSLREAYDRIRELWSREKDTAAKRNESRLEAKFIRPLFRTLGIPFEAREKGGRNDRLPDYGFFESTTAARDACERRDGGDFYDDAVAVADAKRWGRPLDTRGERNRDFENPSYRIHVYLQETPAQWAVLTNGKQWRLYYGQTSHRLDSYYEIDLPTMLEDGGLADFKYFYLFFRHEAFVPDSGGDCFLDDVYRESNVFAQELGQNLQDNIYEAIEVLSQGFLDYADNDLSRDTLVEKDLVTDSTADFEDARLSLVHDSSLVYLYRLIFVLYAESEGRNLLDTSNEIYENTYSLDSLKREVAQELDSDDSKYHGSQNDLWSRLAELFALVDRGSESSGIPEEDLSVPAYDGGLFRTDPDDDDSRETRFLAEYEAGDAAVARVIELLTRSEDTNGGGTVFVDYSSLDVRHLGSIYEGLLEYRLDVADEPLALEDGEYVVANEDDETVVEGDEVYLTTDSGERKTTGSYYTPEYVVEYIVENSLAPLVEDIREELVGQSSFGANRGFADEFARRVFDLKVLDSAMGSGHFLTNAVDYLARQIIDAQERQAKQQGIETVDSDHDVNWARRQVAQRCLYGVDVNPLAVELAKVSLWLRTLADERPLAFLDHHLKTGNSLVGCDVAEIEELDTAGGGEGTNATVADFGNARKGTIEQSMCTYQDFIATENQELADVEQIEARYDEFERDELRRRLDAMANVYTAASFGLDCVPTDVYERLALALEDDSEWESLASSQWFEAAQRLAADEYFFHWKLEYPEVFYDESGDERSDGGFDAVIGNPPYVNVSQIPANQRGYLSDAFSETYAGNSDILYYFMQLGLELSRDGGRVGLIVARYFTQARYADGLREYLLENGRMDKVVDFGNFQAFPGIDVLADIVFCTRDEEPEEYDVTVVKLSDDNVGTDRVRDALPGEDPDTFSTVDLDVGTLSERPWNLIDETTSRIKRKMEAIGWELGTHYDVVQSMQTGFNEGLVVDEETVDEYDIEPSLLRPLAKTKNVRRYLIEDLGEYVLWTEVDDIDEYPNAKAYLEQYRDELANRYDIEQRGANWWQISNPRNEELFSRSEPRILTPFMSTSNKFAIDTDQRFNDGGDIRAVFARESAPTSMAYVLAILDSKLGEFYHKNTAKLKRDGYYEYYGSVLERFPVYDVSTDEPEPDVVNRVEHQYERYRRGEIDSIPWLQAHGDDLAAKGAVVHDLLGTLAERMREFRERRSALDLHLPEYLGSYDDGVALGEMDGYQPAPGVGESVLGETATTREKLRVGRVDVTDRGGTLVVEASARYKPEDEGEFETDSWGYTETGLKPAFRFTGLDEPLEALVKTFVEYAVNEGNERFANFRSTATKNKSLVDRLNELTLPALADVESGLTRYVETAETANELATQRRKTDEVIDEIVFRLYGLTESEIETVNELFEGE
ncbi:Eco57I restriction-modification methylase domain-containing protein [Haladaptatus sp. NG-WS-4]